MTTVANDSFFGSQPGVGTAMQHVAAVTPDDNNDLAQVSRWLLITVQGAIQFTTRGGETVTLPTGTLAINVWHPMMLSRIFATGTTATGIVVGW
jgi:hypothetical protein